MATNFGTGTDWILDRPLISVVITDPRRLVAQRIARCWDTAKGALAAIGDDPNWGENIRQYILAKNTPSMISAAENALLVAALRDEEVNSGTVSITFDAAGNMTVNGEFDSAAGPFSLVANVNALTAEIIFTFNNP